MRLYHHPLSSNARRAVMTALHLAPWLPRPVALQTVDLSHGAQHAPDFVAMNPMGQVPLLVDGDFRLPESHAIMIYLAEMAPGQTLWPDEPRVRAEVARWMFWCAYHVMHGVGVLNFERWIKRMMAAGDPDAARVAAAEAELRPLVELLDRHLDGRTWIVGDQLTLADLSIAAPLMHAGPAQLPIAGLPHLAAWFARVQALPAWQQTEPGAP